jgi:hypothetical protein
MSVLLPQYRDLHQNVVQGSFKDIKASELSQILESLCLKRSGHHGSPNHIGKEERTTRLLILTCLSYLFEKMKIIENQNQDVFTVCQKLVSDESLLMILVSIKRTCSIFLSIVVGN